MNFSGWYVFLPRANLLLSEEWLWHTLLVLSDLISLFRLKLVGELWLGGHLANRLSENKSALKNLLFFLSFIAYPILCYWEALSRSKIQWNFYPVFQNLKKNSVENLVIKLMHRTGIIPFYEVFFFILTMRDVWHMSVKDRILCKWVKKMENCFITIFAVAILGVSEEYGFPGMAK